MVVINNDGSYYKDGDDLFIATNLDSNYSFDLEIFGAKIVQEGKKWYIYPILDYIGCWDTAPYPGQVLTPEADRTIIPPAQGEPVYVLLTPDSTEAVSYVENDEWRSNSVNIKIPTSEDFIATGSYVTPLLDIGSRGDFYLDDLSFAYAQKARIYRSENGGSETLLHEGYTVEYVDKTATDKSSPTAPSSNSATFSSSTNQVSISWEGASDLGTTYTYSITSVNSSDIESAKSKVESVTITSGIKGYNLYYNNRSTPIFVSGTSANIPLSEFNNVQIATVDKAGNESARKTLYTSIDNVVNLPAVPNLTSVAQQGSNNGMKLNWTQTNSQSNYGFKTEIYKGGTKLAETSNVLTYTDTTA